ncbi:hypothetical protein ACP70R_048717 [Stipagrostis hirtigluma subsp. patula]
MTQPPGTSNAAAVTRARRRATHVQIRIYVCAGARAAGPMTTMACTCRRPAAASCVLLLLLAGVVGTVMRPAAAQAPEEASAAAVIDAAGDGGSNGTTRGGRGRGGGGGGGGGRDSNSNSNQLVSTIDCQICEATCRVKCLVNNLFQWGGCYQRCRADNCNDWCR